MTFNNKPDHSSDDAGVVGGGHNGLTCAAYLAKAGKSVLVLEKRPVVGGSAVSEDGRKLYVTWNGNRGGADSRGRVGFDTCALTVIHIPESDRWP